MTGPNLSSPAVPSATRIPEVPLVSLDTLWMQVGGTLCNLSCTHCFISCGPKNHNHAMMSLAEVRRLLDDAGALAVKDYWITGGEVFLNPQIFGILEAILERGPLGVLTNGTLITPDKARALADIQSRSPHRLTLRISMESFDEEANNRIRGAQAYRKAVEGLRNLAAVGFSPILTVTRSWEEEEDGPMENRFLEFLRQNDVPEPRIKILPGFLLGRLAENERGYMEEERVTEKCFENFPITNLQCASSRMATSKGVFVCPILVDEDRARMGETLKETLRPFPLAHSACYTCRVSGMSCKS
ncbi:MAG: radical SAM protein [Nitrospinae bacterium CG11_big_fil_rev_8_21_14_0_20_56_8]|nr:MAG: radical SAM protein [Nitrospinae bacterium CG11_big_fil_rev_8_21_14_0_20_56_8]